MLKELIKLANHLDNKGCPKEADALDRVINKMAVGPDVPTEMVFEDDDVPPQENPDDVERTPTGALTDYLISKELSALCLLNNQLKLQ